MNGPMRLLLAVAAASMVSPAIGQAGAFDGEKLVEAIRKGDGAEAMALLKAKPNLVNTRSVSGKTPLITAIENRDEEWAGFLLQNGADPNLALRSGETPLMIAARLGLRDVTEWLLGAGARVNDANNMGETALIVAVQGRHVPIVALLMQVGADPDKPDSAAGFSARDYAKRNSRMPQLLRTIEAKKPAP